MIIESSAELLEQESVVSDSSDTKNELEFEQKQRENEARADEDADYVLQSVASSSVDKGSGKPMQEMRFMKLSFTPENPIEAMEAQNHNEY